MLAKIDNPKILSEIIGIISELVTEVRLRFDKNGLSIVAIDPANVSLVSFVLPSVAFSQYEVEEEVLGVSLENLKAILRRAGITSSLIFQTEDNTLKIDIHDKVKRTFRLALIEISSEEKAAPNLEFTNKIEIAGVDLQDSIEDCSIVADSCSFQVKDGKFIIEASGLNSTKSEFSTDEAKIEGTDAKSRYSLEYLQKFIKGVKLVDKVRINFSNDYPLRMEFGSQSFNLSFVLAPRVETE